MTILRTSTLLLLLGFAAPAALVWQALPAQADDGGGEGEGGSGEGESDEGEDETEEDVVRARQAAQTPAPDFSTINLGPPHPGQHLTVTQGASRFP